MKSHTSLRAGFLSVAVIFLLTISAFVAALLTATGADALPRPTAEWRSTELPRDTEGMPRFHRAQGMTTWVHVGDTDCTPADSIGSSHGPDQVWCFEGAGGDSSWPADPDNPWRSWSKFAPPIPQPSKWFLTAEHTPGGSGLSAWCGCDLLGVNDGCDETAFWANPANRDGYGDDWNYPLVLNVDGGDRSGGASLTFDIRYDAECDYDYVHLEFLSSFQVVGTDTLPTWTELARYNGVSGVFGLTVCGGDALGHAAADSFGTPQYGNASWVSGVTVALPTTGGTSATNTRVRWRAASDGAWSDADDRADTQGLVLLDNVSVTFAAGGSASDDFDGGAPGNAFTAPSIASPVTSAQWTPQGLLGNPYVGWRVAFDPDYKNQGNTCEFTADWMFTTRIPLLGQYTNEAGWDYYLVTPSIPCAGWTDAVIEYANYRCTPEGTASGPRNDFTRSVYRVHDSSSGSWSPWNDFDEYVLFGGCDFWSMDQHHDLSPALGGTTDSLQVGFEMLDLSKPGDFAWGKHKNTSWQIDRVSIGSFDGSATSFLSSSIRLFADTFSRSDPAHTAFLDNHEQGVWSGQPGGTRPFEPDDSLSVDVHDTDGLATGSVDLHWRVGTGTPPTYGAWTTKPMALRQQDPLGTPGEGVYAAVIGNTSDEDYDTSPAGEGTPDFIWEAGTTVQYYISATDDAANFATFPAGAAVDSTDVFRFQVLPFARVFDDGVGSRVLIVDGFDRATLDFENSTGFVPGGGIGFGTFTNPAFEEPENLLERALVQLVGGDDDDEPLPTDGGPRWDVYNVRGAGSSVSCDPRVIADETRGLGGLLSDGVPQYDAVVWLHGTFGVYAYADSTALALPAFLAAGGSVISFGSNLTSWAGAPGDSTPMGVLLNQYFGTEYAGAQLEFSTCRVDGEAGTSLESEQIGLYGDCPVRRTFDRIQLAPLVPATNMVLASYADAGLPITEGPALIRNLVNGSGVAIQAGFDLGSVTSSYFDLRCLVGSILWSDLGVLPNDPCPFVSGDAPIPGAPILGFALSQPSPSPFRDRTTFHLAVPSRAHVTLAVHDVLGRRVRLLADGVREPGSYAESWDGRDDAGRSVSTGVYFLRTTAAERVATRKVVVLR